MQDEGYVINSQDYHAGFIQSEKSGSSGSLWTGVLITGIVTGGAVQEYASGRSFIITVNFDKINKNHVETRLDIREFTHFSSGRKSGRQILDTKVYRSIYNKVKLELARKKAQGR